MTMDDPEELIQLLRRGAAASPEAYAVALCHALGEWPMRAAAAQALVRIGAPAVEPLRQALISKDAAVRGCAAWILGQIGHASAVPPLCAALQDLEASVRAQVIEALGRIGDREAVPHLIEMLRYPRSATIEAAAAALGRMGDRRAILPLWEALLDEPAELDAPLSQALCKIARREPGPELREVLQRLRRELRNLDGESRPILAALRRQLEAAAAPRKGIPIPAAAPEPPRASLPVPAAPFDPAAESLPVPAAPVDAASPGTGHASEQDPEGLSQGDRGQAGVQTPVCFGEGSASLQSPETQTGVCTRACPPPSVAKTGAASDVPPPASAASEEILRRFLSVEPEAVRIWTGLRPTRIESDIVFRQRKGYAYAAAARRLARPAFIWTACMASWCSSLPSPQSWWFLAALLLPLLLAWLKLSSEVVRLYFKVDTTTREVVVYRRWRPGDTKRKRLPFDQIDYFLGRAWSMENDAGSRLYVALRDGTLQPLTDNLGAYCHVEVNTRILAVTYGKPGYLLNADAKADDLIAVRPDGGLSVRSRAKLWKSAKLLYTPDESAKAGGDTKNL